MPDTDRQGDLVDDLVAAYAQRLEQDLAYAAPEMWPTHIHRRMEELADELAETEPDDA